MSTDSEGSPDSKDSSDSERDSSEDVNPTSEAPSEEAEAPQEDHEASAPNPVGECTTEAMQGIAPMPNPSVMDCDGHIARVGQPNTDWIAVMVFNGRDWEHVKPFGETTGLGMTQSCYSAEQLASGSASIVDKIPNTGNRECVAR
ncbi:hypothetical protein GC425_02470 [Corynebacterium sp. zg254]|uniref:Uncharacterized protein n=1 Tax=Corynebacterium zhongnanshanii TaxID=2768834 RepID=A0ABQ6VFH5_9CORY|nr:MULTISPECIES: hypothetical protein [Corynebacterium]KAB3523159.1 hypothetical protein F8377_03155 [Corynebacterium zhongnanshanii]MCR5913735.1 hypothetical protein [Corynebacterium sp. zg254]